MDYEKAYNELIEKLNDAKEKHGGYTFASVIDTILLELKESEDEKIRKAIFKSLSKKDARDVLLENGIQVSDALAWLEKQGEQKHADKVEPKFKVGDTVTVKPMSCHGKAFKGEPFKIVDIIEDNYVSDDGKTYSISLQDGWELVEQKPTDKVEPKFKVGDWIINNDKRIAVPIQILKIEEYGYVTSRGYTSFDKVKTDYHLWTIQDAKDGDVLATDSGRPFTFKGLLDMYHSESPVAYCGIAPDNYFDNNSDENNEWWTDEKVYPATREQCDFLFQKMKEAGYEWDAEKKELKKSEQKSADEVKPKFASGDYIRYRGENYKIENIEKCGKNFIYKVSIIGEPSDPEEVKTAIGIAAEKDMVKIERPSTTWSEEDEEMYQSILDDTVQKYLLDGNQFAWLKSLRDRVKPQPKQDWNEEDKANLDNIIWLCENCENGIENTWIPSQAREIKKLIKSLKPQPSQEWSEEDEKCLTTIIYEIKANKHESESYEYKTYDKLIDWLKSLKPNHWKPSEEQMIDLYYAGMQLSVTRPSLKTLYEQLKNL